MPRESRLSLRISPKLRATAEKMAKYHGVTITQYIEGVIALDALLQFGNESGLKAQDIPFWLLTRKYDLSVFGELRNVIKKHQSKPKTSTLVFPDE